MAKRKTYKEIEEILKDNPAYKIGAIIPAGVIGKENHKVYLRPREDMWVWLKKKDTN